jgi:hypothetical protein
MAKAARLGPLALIVLAGAACGRGALGGDGGAGTGGSDAADGAPTLARKIDVLFMIDDSSSMVRDQANLVMSLSAFMDVLKAMPGGLPDVHLAVVTSDMGAGDGSISGCAGHGDNGVFRYAPTGSCVETGLLPGATFIADTGGAAPETNFGLADVTSVLECIAQTGSEGCGYEHQLASVARALGADGSPAPPENVGFLRPDAALAIIMLTDEDDCSAPIDSVIFDNGSNDGLASTVGPPGQFRCMEFGYLCRLGGGSPAPPLRISPTPNDLTATLTYDSCVSAEGSGLLTPIQQLASGIKALKADPDHQILVASFQGPATPIVEHWKAPAVPDTGPWPDIEHSCDGGSALGVGDPGVRMQQFVRQFGANGLVYSVCSNTFWPQLQEIGTKLGQLVDPGWCGPPVDGGGCP